MRIDRVEQGFAPSADGRSTFGRSGMVATAAPGATDAGALMLSLGGNAVDAACAAGLALGVCEPQASGFGGQCLGVVHIGGRTFALDGSSRVPSLAHLDRFRQGDRRYGHRGTTVPSAVATYAWLNRTHGRLPWRVVLEPSLELARRGYPISQLQHDLQERELARFDRVDGRSGARYFLSQGVRPFEPGALFRQPHLAAMIDHLAAAGPEDFYTGEIAAQIDADMRANDGFLRADDLALVPWPIERVPLRRRYRGVTLVTMPPPGAGRVLLLVMMMLERLETGFLASGRPERHHFVAETFRKAFLQRLDRPYDPARYPQVKDKTLLSRRFAADLASSIDETMDATLPLVDIEEVDQLDDIDGADRPERGETTHLSVMDADGNAVAMTQSVELVYGSKAAADGLGFLYNNYMLALDREDPAHPYFHRPNAVPWSTACPTLVFHRGRPWLALGSPGSERIFSSVAQVLVHLVDGSLSLDAAISSPRLHCSVGAKLSYEADRFPKTVPDYLASTGYSLDPREPWSFYLGCVQAVLRCHDGSGFQGCADPRRDGTAAAP
ncbi:MAG: gamma-glutamyltransferase [Acidimicrobiales bacterium]|nr:gamma-glutamyltransferase [Acidimicrobiales bacterium]